MPIATLTARDNDTSLRAFVDTFYQQVSTDALLQPFFAPTGEPASSCCPAEYQFWLGVLEGTRYEGRPFPRPRLLPELLMVFDHWQRLLRVAIDEHLPRSLANDAKAKALNMAVMLQHQAVQQLAADSQGTRIRVRRELVAA